MFIFNKKLTGDNGSVCYHWHVSLDDIQIGAAYLDIGPNYQALNIHLYRVAHMPESVIKAIAKDLKHLANNYLLDVDEDYKPFLIIKVTYYDDRYNPIFY